MPNGRYWTPEEVKQLRFMWTYKNLRELSKEFHRTEQAIYYKAKVLRLGSVDKGAYSMKELIRETGYESSTISNAAEQCGIVIHRTYQTFHKTKNGKRPKNARFRFSEDQKEKILEFLAKWPNGRRLYGTSKQKTMNGVWGQGNKPEVCLHCKTTKYSHSAKGYCRYCYNNVIRGMWGRGNIVAQCQECKGTEAPHKAKGLCTRCYARSIKQKRAA